MLNQLLQKQDQGWITFTLLTACLAATFVTVLLCSLLTSLIQQKTNQGSKAYFLPDLKLITFPVLLCKIWCKREKGEAATGLGGHWVWCWLTISLAWHATLHPDYLCPCLCCDYDSFLRYLFHRPSWWCLGLGGVAMYCKIYLSKNHVWCWNDLSKACEVVTSNKPNFSILLWLGRYT